jgi:cytochrome c-type biogenesis protein CcmH/NrfF
MSSSIKHRLKRSFLFLTLAAAAFAQSESQLESDEVKRVGTHLACQCGACTENINCMMSSGQCHFCKPARAKVFGMQQAGMSDTQIVASFIQEYGDKIFRHDPNSYFWLVPYLSLAAGAVVVFFVLRRIRGHQPLKPAMAGGGHPPIDDDPTLAHYREAIEKDTARLE